MLGRLHVQSMKFLVLPMMIVAIADSFLKEIFFVPSGVKQIAFFVLGPVIAGGMILMLPYSSSRIRLVTPRRISAFVLAVAVSVSLFQAIIWGIMYNQVVWFDNRMVNGVAQTLKDVILVSSALLYGLLTSRLLHWYRRTRNSVVLLFGMGALGFALFAAIHILPDYVSQPIPRIIPDALAASFLLHVWGYWPAMWLMLRAYFGRRWKIYLPAVVAAPLFESAFLLVRRLGIPLDRSLDTLVNMGLIVSPLVYLWGIFLLVPTIANPTGKDYYRAMGYSFGLTAAANCGMGLTLMLNFPLNGFASLTMLLPAAALSFAGFTSCAAYYSISDDLRKEIQGSVGFIASIGEAESRISVEQKIGQFYDRFTGLARESGAVQDAALTKDDIYSYAAALKKLQTRSSEVA